jgi:hypothetical protein
MLARPHGALAGGSEFRLYTGDTLFWLGQVFFFPCRCSSVSMGLAALCSVGGDVIVGLCLAIERVTIGASTS